ncbi:unnamed protein product [Prorocentrum cordatum]|uniref:Calcineurin-like phosphoesterase domain-containing protein n=1 Tax=Prorocentrum cordatum TaxID=2364126 RepID=A0ABN9T5L0_9DINO|nr:unnamed protein product [Polarella glacialis]
MAGTRSASLDCAQSSPSSRSRGIRLGKIVRSPTPEPMRRSLTGGKRYYSRGFERPRHERRELWQQLPEGLDLLLTHGPPLGRLCSDKVGDELLKARLAEMAAPPRFHVFGHDHRFLGIDSTPRTIFLNVAQDEALRSDPRAGGCALVFDVEAKGVPGDGCAQ